MLYLCGKMKGYFMPMPDMATGGQKADIPAMAD